jgi:MurNAc alpha-1-phosphate uridylyltransferase
MPARVTTAMVLSAGLGTRMAPANNSVPKPLVRLNGKALIDHVLDRHVEAGIMRAVVNVHHKADLIEAHLKGRRKPAIEISDERSKLLDTGGGVKGVLPRLGGGVFLIHNADSV